MPDPGVLEGSALPTAGPDLFSTNRVFLDLRRM